MLCVVFGGCCVWFCVVCVGSLLGLGVWLLVYVEFGLGERFVGVGGCVVV